MSNPDPDAVLTAICAVDNVAPSVIDRLLSARDAEWHDIQRREGREVGNTALLTPETDDDYAFEFFVARSLESHEDAAGPSLPPTTAFTSPFLGMTPEEIALALRKKQKSAENVSYRLFVIVDSRSAEDDTVWLCEDANGGSETYEDEGNETDEDEGNETDEDDESAPGENEQSKMTVTEEGRSDKNKGSETKAPRIKKVRAEMAAASSVMVNLKICNTDMEEFIDAAEVTNGVFEDVNDGDANDGGVDDDDEDDGDENDGGVDDGDMDLGSRGSRLVSHSGGGTFLVLGGPNENIDSAELIGRDAYLAGNGQVVKIDRVL